MDLIYTNTITADEVNAIRKSMGWRQNHPEQFQDSLNGSTLIVAAYKEGKAIGMVRLIWDGGEVAVIPNILILPEYQMQGIENEMLSRIFDFLRSKLKPGYGIQVDIRVWNNQEPYYERIGFQASTPQRRGTPMHICLTNQIELTDAIFKQCGFSEK